MKMNAEITNHRGNSTYVLFPTYFQHKRQLGQYTYAYNRRCRSGGHKALYEFFIEISIINAYKLS